MKGYIYCLRSHQTEKIYIGSTKQKLYQRINDHRKKYRQYLLGNFHYLTAYEILQYDDVYIELIEECNFETKLLLEKKEGEYIRNMNCVNKYIPARKMKEWSEDNKEHLKIQKQIKYTCECGKILTKQSKTNHIKSIYHLNYITNL